ncbi:hypothetical protein B9Q13_03965 [Candidatus Marsarchaeota G2 archaeon ECH_B_SAG-G16]|jgi:twin arginine-targeting protein translocase, TatA/E family|uniref:Sec-independent protein translocase protein TatA n=6 Tax=Candidatus Marsarchaeota TaxID=1978152 RepID=A0A2R6C1R3_9ARCH|nr:MAG: hypothetical protein B9Q01_02275 [Candidatus Marsarchaeota G1 archaeon OSP_D]PSN85767.1 MAG: hypothetical protein B9Q02_04920 [Candidatus Marsarchaeota G1 archaeon BE_D]PSN89044.1 MAG: hypothetical protein B9Q00_03035 [Candidatus Marsarchaeota G1 archaeon OSP_C]PSO04654.1 MAG: hypothetical protein B9Q13_03965 [Candidatus Marsarchaeota G2 archaeon ECH_B_SAG-G16]PSO04793.1 MAG: hypothetical protein B9Q12_01810 [Candidatus Marsarchaeota G2 archaeon ECH_B_SAG-G06]
MLDSLWDWLIFIAVVLVLFGGANKIPELARGLGRAMGEFRKGQAEVEKEIRAMMNQEQKTEQTSKDNTQNDSKYQQKIAELEAEISRLKQELKKSA